jgi:type III restriction enzyme
LKPFYQQPILNSPYYPPTRHHALGDDGRPLDEQPRLGRRSSRYMTPVPASRRRSASGQVELALDAGSERGRYSPNVIVNEIRGYLEAWRRLPAPADWGVTVTTILASSFNDALARLLLASGVSSRLSAR